MNFNLFFYFVVESFRFLRFNKKMDMFFVEIDLYKKVENMFLKNGIVVFIGLFGCGKIIVVIYLICKELYDWNFRKICLWEEFLYIDEDLYFLVFIDNIFFCRMMDLDFENWWNKLDNIYENYFIGDDVEVRLNYFCIVMIV